MRCTFSTAPVQAGGLSRYLVVRVGVIAAVVLAATLMVASSSFAAKRHVSSTSRVQLFRGDKACVANPTPPLVVCTYIHSNVPLLLNASVAYVSVPESQDVGTVFERDDSDVVLTTAVLTGGRPSTAHGHCTFYANTGTGICTFGSGTQGLDGFHAAFSIGTNTDGTFSVIGKYWFDDDNQQ